MKSLLIKNITTAFLLLLAVETFAQPVVEGKKWEKVEALSDEFNGKKLTKRNGI